MGGYGGFLLGYDGPMGRKLWFGGKIRNAGLHLVYGS